MMLGAWGDGVVSCPNGIRDADAAAEICGGEVRAIVSFGYPATAARPGEPQRGGVVGAGEPQAALRARPRSRLADPAFLVTVCYKVGQWAMGTCRRPNLQGCRDT